MTASSTAMPNDDTDPYGNGEAPVELLDDLRTELEQAADDISRLTESLRERNLVVERLETLIAEVLGFLTAPAVVVDGDGKIVAVSQGAVDDYPGITEGSLGEPSSNVLPAQLADDIMAVIRAPHSERRETKERRDETDQPARWADVSDASVLRLPGGWALVMLDT